MSAVRPGIKQRPRTTREDLAYAAGFTAGHQRGTRDAVIVGRFWWLVVGAVIGAVMTSVARFFI